jgi:hypothetical protein
MPEDLGDPMQVDVRPNSRTCLGPKARRSLSLEPQARGSFWTYDYDDSFLPGSFANDDAPI